MIPGQVSGTVQLTHRNMSKNIYYNIVACQYGFVVACNIIGVIDNCYSHQTREGNGNPLQYSCLGNLMNKRVWWVTVHGAVKELDMMAILSD